MMVNSVNTVLSPPRDRMASISASSTLLLNPISTSLLGICLFSFKVVSRAKTGPWCHVPFCQAHAALGSPH